MAFSHGSIAKIYVDGFDASPFFSDVTMGGSIDTAETTTLGKTAKTYIPGNEDATFKCSGFLDHNSIDANSFDYKLKALTRRASVPITYLPASDLAGEPAYIGTMELTAHDIGTTVKDAASCDVEFQTNTGFPRGLSAAATSAQTATGFATYLDDLAATTKGLSAALQIFSVSGTTPSITVKLQSSADHTTWADLLTFNAATGVGSQYQSVSGNVDRYIRLAWTISGTSPSFTFHVAYSRGV